MSYVHGERKVVSHTLDASGNLYASEPAPNTRHNRYLDLTATAGTWPGDDSFAVTFTQNENVRRYRVRAFCATAGNHIRWVEDAVNEAQAESWLTASDGSDGSADVEYMRVFSFGVQSATTGADGWSEWKELSVDPDLPSLSRLDFLGSADEQMYVEVEAE
jgi:hypothetical protein